MSTVCAENFVEIRPFVIELCAFKVKPISAQDKYDNRFNLIVSKNDTY